MKRGEKKKEKRGDGEKRQGVRHASVLAVVCQASGQRRERPTRAGLTEAELRRD